MLRFLAGLLRNFTTRPTFTTVELNGAPGLLVRDGGELTAALGFECLGGEIAGVQVVMNPEKLDFVERQVGRV
ncbi:hypothetical protein [Streptomyces sp. 3214.6]|uniref:hypothetical protein n=1 Tax=Streptomyces sp. 3214.6 TaxID=1882757 RepID=UPI0009A56851|nr:hypothetical protein [Streptomyces sp. 3214.6]